MSPINSVTHSHNKKHNNQQEKKNCEKRGGDLIYKIILYYFKFSLLNKKYNK